MQWMVELSFKLGRMLGMHQLMVWPLIAASCALVPAFLVCWLLVWCLLRIHGLSSPSRGSALYLALWTFASGIIIPLATMQSLLMPPLVYISSMLIAKREFRTTWSTSGFIAILAIAVTLAAFAVFVKAYQLLMIPQN
jgi:hypothetical protein